MKKKIFFLAPIFLAVLAILACSSKPQISALLRDPLLPYRVVQETFAKEGKSDYFLVHDEGYAFRLIYLCENRVFNFVEEPEKNPVLVSQQPILDTLVEKKLLPDDRRRIWACMERKVREEKLRMEDIHRQLTQERLRLEEELRSARAEREKLVVEIEQKKKLEAQRQRKAEEEMRKVEEERLRRFEEDQLKKAEEERKIKAYRTAIGIKEEVPPPSTPPPRVAESGIFMLLKEGHIHEEPKKTSKVVAKARKYEIFEVINSKKDEDGGQWFQLFISERVISDKGKKYGWTPEERSFWVKNKLLAWVYPGDLAKIHMVKPLKLNVEEIHYTGKKASTIQKPSLYEVFYEVNVEFSEKLYGWLDEDSGVRRSNKDEEEMKKLLTNLSRTLWPMRIQHDILRGLIRTGFTPEQVVLSWGRPDHVNTTRTLVGIHEQWVYGENPFPNAYIYFENGLVKSWEFLKKSGK